MTNMTRFYKDAFKMLVVIIVGLALARFTKGYFCILLVLWGIFSAVSNKAANAIGLYVGLTTLLVISPHLVPKQGAVWNYSLRFGTLIIAFLLAIGSFSRHGKHRLPFIGIIPFLIVACISSINGYFPSISFAKIINYLLFLAGIWFGTQNMQQYPKDLYKIRCMIFAMAMFIIFGSIALIPFPSIAYALSMRSLVSELGAEGAEIAFREASAEGARMLFSGVTCHSQWLAPILAILLGWLICDMMFVEKRLRSLHVALIVLSLPLLYLTRSRVAFTTAASALIVIYFYTVNKISVESHLKRHLKNGMFLFVAAVVLGAIALEIKEDAISQWLRKTSDVEGDERSLTEAMTSSRMGLIEESMDDFRMNPAFGMGFQTCRMHPYVYANQPGLIFSAPIEKGVLPVMVLGETGVVGLIFFIVFLITFYVTAAQRKLYVTITMFTLLFVSNLGEASFFAPGGIGSCLWVLSVVGGFIIDTQLLYERQQRRLWLNG